MERIPLESIPALLALVDNDLASDEEMEPDRVRLLLKTHRITLIALQKALEELRKLEAR